MPGYNKIKCPCCGCTFFVTRQGLVFRTPAAARMSISEALRAVLDDYYRIKNAGHRVKLAGLARTAGVNYGSLRRAKMRYDKNSHAPSSTTPQT